VAHPCGLDEDGRPGDDIYIQTYICTHTHMYIYTCTYIYNMNLELMRRTLAGWMRMAGRATIYMYKYRYEYTYTRTRAYIYIYIYIT